MRNYLFIRILCVSLRRNSLKNCLKMENKKNKADNSADNAVFIDIDIRTPVNEKILNELRETNRRLREIDDSVCFHTELMYLIFIGTGIIGIVCLSIILIKQLVR